MKQVACTCTCMCGSAGWGGAESPAPAVTPSSEMCCASSVHPRSKGWRDLGICGMSIWECASDPQTT